MIAAQGEVLLHPTGRIRGQLLHHLVKAFHGGGKAAGVQAQRRIAGGHGHIAGNDDVAFVNSTLDEMPRDPVLLFTFDQRPDRGIQTRVARQGPIVEIDRPALGKRQKVVWNDIKVRNAQKPVKRLPRQLLRRITCQGLHRQAIITRPVRNAGRAGEDSHHVMPRRQQLGPAMLGQRIVTDQNTGKHGLGPH